MNGIKEGETRSGLYYEGYKILKEKRPTYSVIENVKNLTSKRFKKQFESILRDLSELGYTNYWKVLNAKDYNIPQNRERVFIVSIRNDIAQSDFCFPPKLPLMWKLEDLLEDNVDEKYYLSEKAIGNLIKRNHKLINNIFNPNSKATNMNSKPFILVREGTKKGYTEARLGDAINISYPNNITKRGRVGHQMSNTILTSPNMATLKNISNVELKMFNPFNNREITNIAPTQTTSCGITTSSSAVLISEDGKQLMKIRKLLPIETWRLMGFDDEDFFKAKSAGVSDSQLYRQAGNSIVVNILESIFEELFYQQTLEKCA